MILSVQTTELAININVSILVKVDCHVGKVLSALQLGIVQFANVQLDGEEIHQLNVFSVS
jgi:hypothetical protein